MKRKKTLVEDLDAFLSQLCQDWGFCCARTTNLLTANTKEVSAEDFTKAVLTAEGMNPDCEVEWCRHIRNRFVDRYGATISAENFAED